jgi:lysophospholipase L1-like esterase
MKRLFIAFLSVSIYLGLYLVAGMAPGVTQPPPLEATEAAAVDKRPSGFLAGGILSSRAGPPMAAPIVSGSGDGPTWVVSCLGDSITEGVPYSGMGNTYPARLQVMLDAAYGSGSFQVVNHGVGGYRADQVLADLQNLNWMAEDNPDLVLLLVGGNDLSQETGGDPSKLPQVISDTVAEVQEIVNVVTAHTNADGSHPQIIVSAIIPSQDVGESVAVALYNSSLESNLTGMDLWTIDNWDDFYDPGTGQARASLMSDNVHPNEAGYIVMAENWFEATNFLLHHLYLPLILRNY